MIHVGLTPSASRSCAPSPPTSARSRTSRTTGPEPRGRTRPRRRARGEAGATSAMSSARVRSFASVAVARGRTTSVGATRKNTTTAGNARIIAPPARSAPPRAPSLLPERARAETDEHHPVIAQRGAGPVRPEPGERARAVDDDADERRPYARTSASAATKNAERRSGSSSAARSSVLSLATACPEHQIARRAATPASRCRRDRAGCRGSRPGPIVCQKYFMSRLKSVPARGRKALLDRRDLIDDRGRRWSCRSS